MADSANDSSPGSMPDGPHPSPAVADPDSLTAEERRLREARAGIPWRAWGPYLSERQWGTVREDYSDNEDAWSYFSHDQARSRAYRWGEDGIAGISDDKQRLCLALALWNERDPILKERLFGLTNAEGNHGEDVKEYYFYVDNLPTHSYQRYLYKYPQAEFPYNDLVAVNRSRSRHEIGVRAPRYGCLRRGPLFRCRGRVRQGRSRGHPLPHHRAQPLVAGRRAARAADAVVPQHLVLGRSASPSPGWPGPNRPLRSSGPITPRPGSSTSTPSRTRPCCSARTRRTRRGSSAPSPTTHFPKDGIGDHLAARRGHGQSRRRGHQGGRAHPADRCRPAGRPRCWSGSPARARRPSPRRSPARDELIARRRAEADEFYDAITPPAVTDDAKSVMRQALAGMLWSKQCYYFDVDRWLRERRLHPLRAPIRRGTRNESWFHMFNHDVVSMPDKWEYPWYAAWDLAFHCIPLGMVDPDFAQKPDRPDAVPGIPAPERPDAGL